MHASSKTSPSHLTPTWNLF